MVIGLLGRKIGMSCVFDSEGRFVPVTVIEAGPCNVVQKKTCERDGYSAVQLGFLEKRENLLRKPDYYHLKKHSSSPVRYIREFRVDQGTDLDTGSVLTVEMVSAGQKVSITGVSKGKGFQGVVKRHGFSGGRASHGCKNHRTSGSIGQCSDPSKVFKNVKMPGRMGHDTVTVKNLDVVNVDVVKNLLLVKGSVPGAAGGLLRIIPKEA